MPEINFHKKFKPLFHPPKWVRYFIVTGGRFSMKSYTVASATVYNINNLDKKALYVRYTMDSAHDSIIPEVYEKVELMGLQKYYSQTRTKIKGVGNREVAFKGLRTSSGNQTAKLKSVKGISIFVVEEAEEWTSEEEFDKLNFSIRDAEGSIVVLVLNPTTKEHFIYKKFFLERGVQPGYCGIKDDVCYIHTSYLDALRFVPDDILREIERLKETNYEKYLHIIMGGWLDRAEGVVFKNWRYGEFDKSVPQQAYGLDFGYFPDPDSLNRVGIDRKNRKIYVDELLYKNQLGTDDLKRNIKASITDKKPIIADSSRPRTISDLKASKLNVKPVSKTKTVEYWLREMQDYEIIITPKSTKTATELNNYCYSDKKAGIPIDSYNHSIDNIRYVFMYFSQKTSFKSVGTT